MKLENKKVLVVGAGKSGIASARFLKSKGALVTINDIKGEEELENELLEIKGLGIPYIVGRHEKEVFAQQDLIVVSPGVPHDTEPFNVARKKGIEMIGEMELAFRFISTPIIAITGTNGKTTTTTLIGEILKNAGISAFVGGNIGTPLIEYAYDDSKDLAVVEVSSFQLETVRHFHPFGGVILNITPDHLDRYSSMEEYAETKMRLFDHMESFDFAVLNNDDDWIMRYKPSILAEIYLFSTKKKLKKGCFLGEEGIYVIHPSLKDMEYIRFEEIRLKGVHNMENVMASLLTTLELGVGIDKIRETLSSFSGLSHRLEYVDEIEGVSFYDDSKGTNVGAVEKALSSFKSPVVLIMGGKEKGAGYTFLEDQVKRIVKTIVAIGEAKEKIYEDLHNLTCVIKADTMEDAVRKAYEVSEKGDVVLLSPACSSFDMFSGYAERGEKFVEAVKKLKGEIVGKA
ncbi:MAG: UDP-N-acetylmuramoyl-L-alanine--D-glutamate ligase [bacterium]